jgi:hypothetical protein
MKRILIDTNFNYLGPSCPALSAKEVMKSGLKKGEKIIAYQDDDEWEGIVSYAELLPPMYQWFIQLKL